MAPRGKSMAAAFITSRNSRSRRRIAEHLHCSRGAYLTWVTDGLMVVQYYLHAQSYLIDPSVMPLESLAGDCAVIGIVCVAGLPTICCADRRSGNTPLRSQSASLH